MDQTLADKANKYLYGGTSKVYTGTINGTYGTQSFTDTCYEFTIVNNDADGNANLNFCTDGGTNYFPLIGYGASLTQKARHTKLGLKGSAEGVEYAIVTVEPSV